MSDKSGKTDANTHDFARIEGGATPAGGLCGVAVETTATEILGLLGRCVVGVHYGEGGMRVDKGGRVLDGARRGRAVEWCLGRHDDGGGVVAVQRVKLMD